MSTSSGEMRLQKFLSRAGVASRRAAEALMTQGRVRVNGEPIQELGTKVDPVRDRVELDGALVELPSFNWILLNKPAGTLTTKSDPGGRPTVYSLLPEEHRALRYVGRLDLDTEGLLLFTNDGEAIHHLLHPSSEVPREYEAWVVGIPTRATLRRLEQGVELDDGPARAEGARVLRTEREGKGALVGLRLREGRKREVRRLFEAVEHPVRSLRRVRFGPIELGRTPPGEWRKVTRNEIRALRKAAGLAAEPGSPGG